MMMKRTSLFFAGLIAVSCVAVGCSQAPSKPGNKTAQAKPHDDHAGHKNGDDHDHDEKPGTVDDHSSWWCKDHGVPEAECGQCSSKLAGEFQKKGDWCKEHERPDSQCFHCHPEKQVAYAAKYEAKYGKQPPKLNLK